MKWWEHLLHFHFPGKFRLRGLHCAELLALEVVEVAANG